MEKFLLKLKKLVDRDLNEYVKWVILLGLYLFYRMLEKAFAEERLVFLVVPLLFLAISTLLIDWIIDYLIRFTRLINRKVDKSAKGLKGTVAVSLSYYLGIALLTFLYLWNHVSFISTGVFLIMASGLLSRAYHFSLQDRRGFLAMLLLLTGLAGSIHSLILENALNTINFIFYIAFLAFYVYLSWSKPPGSQGI